MNRTALSILLLALCTPALPALASEFIYQGQLDDRGAPANGRYDLRITAFDDEKTAAPQAAPVTFRDVEVKDGRFELRFDAALANTRETWLEVAVRDAGGARFSTIPGRSKAIAAPLIGACWSSAGDTGSNPTTNFLGTTDAQPLVLRTANVQSLRIEPSAELFGGSPITANVIAGSRANVVSAGVRGATIAGGGTPSGAPDPDYGPGSPNLVTDSYGSILGGFGNQAGDGAGGTTNRGFATVGGGLGNLATGGWSTIAGGEANSAGWYGGVGGGSFNVASGYYSSVGGGSGNVASGDQSSVLGGDRNSAGGLASTVSGGGQNVANGNYGSVSGGRYNAASAGASTVPGGSRNCAGAELSLAAGHRAKARPATDPNDGGPCDGLTSYPSGYGDRGSFIWADFQDADFETSGPNQFLVRAGGGVGINTNNLPVAVDLALTSRSGNADLWMRPDGQANGINFAAWGDATQAALYIARFDGISYTDYALWQSDGRLRVFFDNPIKPTSGGWAAPSDARLKQDIEPLQHSLDRLLALRGVRYAYRTDAPNGYFTPGTHTGFVAQEVEAVFPEWLSNDADGYKLVAPQGFEALAVEALRELRDRGLDADAAQAERIAVLERENAKLHAALATLAAEQARALAELRAALRPAPPSESLANSHRGD
ncbi:MAG: tail fiber domain-containing protein [Xanthomonadales bacterium]|nr:tail fiber domain-containing protein [Xanthomonadales bacterium]